MSVHFNGSTDLLSWTGQLFTAYPCAIFGWGKPTAANVSQMACAVGSTGGSPNEQAVYFNGSSSTKVLGYTKNAGGASQSSASTTAISTAWQPFMVTLTASGTTVTVYYAAGAAVGASCSPAITQANMTKFVIGAWAEAASLQFTGDLAEFAAWQGTIPDGTDFTSMAGGTLPETIKSGTLVDSWSLLTGGANQVGTVSRTLTATGTTTGATHPITRGGGGGFFSRAHYNRIWSSSNV